MKGLSCRSLTVVEDPGFIGRNYIFVLQLRATLAPLNLLKFPANFILMTCPWRYLLSFLVSAVM